MTFNAPGGFQTLDVVNVLVNTALDGRQACYLAYSRPSNALYIVADNGDSTQLSGKVMDGAGTVANSQCTVMLPGSSATGTGNTLTLVLNLSFSASFGGNKVIYAAARDLSQSNSGWQTMGVHGVPPLPSTFPSPVGMSPSSGSALSQTITFTYRDQTSATNLQTVWALTNTAIDGRAACYVAYYRPGNQLYLYPDNGDGTQATNIVLTGSNTISNSQCTISAQGASVQTSGNTLTLTLPITFKTAFAGFKDVWLAAQTMGGTQTSPWQALGAWAVPGGGCLAGQPAVTLNTPAAGATQLSGHTCNVDPAIIKVVIYVLTNQWYVQPYVAAPFTDIADDGSWTSSANPWSSIVVLLVNPANYTPAATKITNPALDPGVLAWTVYPQGPASVSFGGRTWGIKVTGNAPGYRFDPGPNFWSNETSVVNVAADGLHLKIVQINGNWQCGEVYLTESLGYGTYTVRVASRLDQLDPNTVAAPLYIYAAPDQELDNEYSGVGGLIPTPYNAQFVVQPFTVSGNIVRYVQPPAAQFTSQMEWRADHVTFRTWNGWSSVPAPGDIIYQWTYTGAFIPPPGNDRVHINLWLLNGAAPISGTGDTMIVNSFTFQP